MQISEWLATAQERVRHLAEIANAKLWRWEGRVLFDSLGSTGNPDGTYVGFVYHRGHADVQHCDMFGGEYMQIPTEGAVRHLCGCCMSTLRVPGDMAIADIDTRFTEALVALELEVKKGDVVNGKVQGQHAAGDRQEPGRANDATLVPAASEPQEAAEPDVAKPPIP